MKPFQIRLVHRIIAINVVLTHISVEYDVTCSFIKKRRRRRRGRRRTRHY